MADGYTSIRDMFDGGGAGQSGAQFGGGGLLSAAANAIARPRGSVDRGDADMRTGVGGFLRDAVNGGGWGASGGTFQGAGGYSGLLNMLGVKPMGEAQRMADSQAQLQSQLADLYARRQPAPVAPAQPAAGMTVPAISAMPASNVAFPNAATGPMPSTELGFGAPATRRAPIRAGDNVSSLYGDYVTGADMLGLGMPDERAYYRYLMTGKW